VLVVSAAAVPLLVTACRGVQVLGAPPPPAPDITQLRSAIAAERLMIDRYGLAGTRAAGHPAAAGRLAALLTEHRQHLALLQARLVVPPGSAAGAAPDSSATAIRPLPDDLEGTLGALAADEQAAAQRLGRQLLVMPPSLAQLLASIAASEATHVPVLSDLRRTS
jgi:hypothetical protein